VATRYESVRAGGLHLPPGDYVVLEVADTGRGMSEQTQARAFGPFFTTKPSGRGLGLSVVREIVREYGGVIGVESAPGRGSAFHVFLPSRGKRARRPRAVPCALSVGVAAGAGICVLIVEDQDALRLAVSRMLRKHGFTVLEAHDGYSAVEFFRKRADAIDVVLLDWAIAGASSGHVSEQARRLRLPAKIILTSAYSREMALAGLDWRPAGFIRKPYEIPDLVRTLHAAVTL
jgi:two-component system cell cycle sensor histidine kinase/response regulator CckA